MFEKFLEEIGLSDKEAKVYLALLKVDNDSVLDLSKKTGVNRTTIYPVLESLSKKGLISEAKIDKKVRYQAEPPERLETYVERQKLKLEEQEKRLGDIVPQLKIEIKLWKIIQQRYITYINSIIGPKEGSLKFQETYLF